MKKRRILIAHKKQWGDKFITILIVLNMVMAGLMTNHAVKQNYGYIITLVSDISAIVFIVEMYIRIRYGGKRFWTGKDKRWNLFDLIITLVSSVSLFFTSSSVIALRIFRQLRILRILSKFKNLRNILDGLMDSITKLAWTSVFFLVMYYIYAIIGIDFFGDRYPQWFGNIGLAMFTLFQVMTMEGWVNITETVMEIYPLAWTYFISFILIVSYILINLIVGIIVSSLREKVGDDEKDEVIEELAKEIDEIKKIINK